MLSAYARDFSGGYGSVWREIGNMYTWKNGNYQHVGANIQKSIKIDAETLEIIEAVAGRSFSDKVRNMAAEYVRLKCDELASKK